MESSLSELKVIFVNNLQKMGTSVIQLQENELFQPPVSAWKWFLQKRM